MMHTWSVQVVMLGSGVPEYEQQMRRAEQERPDAFRGWVGFSIPVSHRIMAGCDLLLMPSRFEPCGLNQLFAMRYGTIPIAHATGGLRDTIEDYNPFAQGKLRLCVLQVCVLVRICSFVYSRYACSFKSATLCMVTCSIHAYTLTHMVC